MIACRTTVPVFPQPFLKIHFFHGFKSSRCFIRIPKPSAVFCSSLTSSKRKPWTDAVPIGCSCDCLSQLPTRLVSPSTRIHLLSRESSYSRWRSYRRRSSCLSPGTASRRLSLVHFPRFSPLDQPHERSPQLFCHRVEQSPLVYTCKPGKPCVKVLKQLLDA
jgi:hypothetical protein